MPDKLEIHSRLLPEQGRKYGDIVVAVRKPIPDHPNPTSGGNPQLEHVEVVADVPAEVNGLAAGHDDLVVGLGPPEQLGQLDSVPAEPVQLPTRDNVELRGPIVQPGTQRWRVERVDRPGHVDVLGPPDHGVAVGVSPLRDDLPLAFDGG